MNVMQNKTVPARRRRTAYKQNLNFRVVDDNPEKIINQKVLNEITKDAFCNTTNVISHSSSGSQIILTVTEGRGQARGEVGIAALDTNSPTLILCQLSDNLHYSDTMNKIQIMNPVKILLPDTIFETHPLPKLVQMISNTFSHHISIIPVQRRHFNDKFGLELIKTYCSQKSQNILQIIERKYYCLSSASALFSYLKHVSTMTFAKNGLRVDYQTKQGGMLIDIQTSTRLELLYSLSSEANAVKNFSLFATLNNCQTKIGQRHLRANILEPSCNLDFIINRQEQIKVLMEVPDTLAELRENLQNFRCVDQLLKISCVVPADNCEKAIETNIALAILLKQCLESVEPLSNVLQKTVSESFEESRQLLSSPIFKTIIGKLDEIVQPDIHKNRLAQKHFQHLFAVRGNVNETIDYLRKLYSEAVIKINEYVEELTNQYQLPIKLIHTTKLGHHLYMKNTNDLELSEDFNVIFRRGKNVYMTTPLLLTFNESTQMIAFDIMRMSNTIFCDMLIGIAKEIDDIHYLLTIIINLDIVQSLTEVSLQESYCCPTFSRVLKLEKAFHPMLESTKTKAGAPMVNNVIATPQYNFYLITGPNMSGKSIYIKMIAIIQIIAQIGCFVPAKSAKLRMTDKLFSRIGFQDSFEQGASSFTVELREMEYIYSNLTPNSLVIMDELCRSTNPQEGEYICWQYCERLLKFIGIVDENKTQNDEDDDPMDGTKEKHSTSTMTLSCDTKLKDVTRPFVYLTTHFQSLTKLPEFFNNAINLSMQVDQLTVEGKLRLNYKYVVQSGPTDVQSYGLALARCLRFPSEMLRRAEELGRQIPDDSYVDLGKTRQDANKSKTRNNDSMMSVEGSTFAQAMIDLDKDVIDLYSYILLLMSSEKNQPETFSSVEKIHQKLEFLISKMSPEFKELINNSSLPGILSILNATSISD